MIGVKVGKNLSAFMCLGCAGYCVFAAALGALLRAIHCTGGN